MQHINMLVIFVYMFCVYHLCMKVRYDAHDPVGSHMHTYLCCVCVCVWVGGCAPQAYSAYLLTILAAKEQAEQLTGTSVPLPPLYPPEHIQTTTHPTTAAATSTPTNTRASPPPPPQAQQPAITVTAGDSDSVADVIRDSVVRHLQEYYRGLDMDGGADDSVSEGGAPHPAAAGLASRRGSASGRSGDTAGDAGEGTKAGVGAGVGYTETELARRAGVYFPPRMPAARRGAYWRSWVTMRGNVLVSDFQYEVCNLLKVGTRLCEAHTHTHACTCANPRMRRACMGTQLRALPCAQFTSVPCVRAWVSMHV